ncbi:hypothetical protein COS51_00965 [Candidatus Roizmanbacteria bacterium CG03_land_8_20_14_0_80_36_21]|uniref:Antitoxin n=2 Tax=Candidatus Roizmaniibacteriota TaxID=1752723 RepID=A0A2M8GL12_9BACT|nr:MAG: hypothetical protein COS51_00965 [Candidatus Roizmanbacteria bacterium CG03_land_8_20_14_0_80_36_21]PJC81238.1 MAG: hypothetical protein CO007_05695 [Candidatus Roizmanbacteria bacterium CG_4_8_14_3_um_filter_36_10]
MNNMVVNQRTINATDIRFNLGKILEDLDRQGSPFLIISRSKPKAWLYPYEPVNSSEDFFLKWQTEALPKYKKIKAKNLISIIRKDRER